MDIKKDCRRKQKVFIFKKRKKENMHKNKIQLHRKI